MQEKKKLQINKYLFISIASICAGIFVWWLVTDGLVFSDRMHCLLR